MKKLFRRLTTGIMALIIGAVGFSGCRLFTVDSEEDINQVVATVNIVHKENIYKKDMIMAYLNYGNTLVESYGYTQAKAYEYILDGLIQNRIIVQSAMQEFENDANFTLDSDEIYSLERYLTEEQEIDAIYATRHSINQLLDVYEDNQTAEKKDTFVGQVRKVPTEAKNKEKELSVDEKKEYNAQKFDTNSTVDRRSAFNKVINLLRNNTLLGADYNGTLESTDYYKQLLQSNQENLMLETYQKRLANQARQQIFTDTDVAYEKLEQYFNDIKTEQENFDNKEFVNKLSSATANEPIVYSSFGNYGYVYNLLLGVDDLQKTEIENIKKENKNLSNEQYAQIRSDILASTIVKDLRSSWIVSGYDFDGEKFTGDYTFAKNSANSLPFKGQVNKIKDATEDEGARYSVVNVDTFSLEGFLSMMNSYLGATSINLLEQEPNPFAKSLEKDIFAANKFTSNVEEYQAKINELLFAFSTDDGSLNTYKGYVIKPEVDGADSEEYVLSFGTAGRELLKVGGQSYVVVASDFGYHVMFFSQIFEAKNTEIYSNLEAYLDSLDIEKTGTWKEYLGEMLADWEEFEESQTPLYYFANQIVSPSVSKYVSNKQEQLTDNAIYKNKQITKYQNAYADLVK